MQFIISFVKSLMASVAVALDRVTGGALKPMHITVLSLAGHLPVVWALVNARPIVAALLLAFFALLDALDGALARHQRTVSLAGMYSDAVSDRVKEVLVFSGIAYFSYEWLEIQLTWLAVAACGTSLLVSYVKAKGEMAVAGHEKNAQSLNRLFSGGMASYEIRTAALVIALLSATLYPVLLILLAANCLTALTRFAKVYKHLKTLPS